AVEHDPQRVALDLGAERGGDGALGVHRAGELSRPDHDVQRRDELDPREPGDRPRLAHPVIGQGRGGSQEQQRDQAEHAHSPSTPAKGGDFKPGRYGAGPGPHRRGGCPGSPALAPAGGCRRPGGPPDPVRSAGADRPAPPPRSGTPRGRARGGTEARGSVPPGSLAPGRYWHRTAECPAPARRYPRASARHRRSLAPPPVPDLLTLLECGGRAPRPPPCPSPRGRPSIPPPRRGAAHRGRCRARAGRRRGAHGAGRPPRRGRGTDPPRTRPPPRPSPPPAAHRRPADPQSAVAPGTESPPPPAQDRVGPAPRPGRGAGSPLPGSLDLPPTSP